VLQVRGGASNVQIQNMRGNRLVLRLVATILSKEQTKKKHFFKKIINKTDLDEKDGVESAENGGVKLDVLLCSSSVVVRPEDRIRRSQNRRARVEHSAKTRLHHASFEQQQTTTNM
jgi:hypothetical protein